MYIMMGFEYFEQCSCMLLNEIVIATGQDQETKLLQNELRDDGIPNNRY